MDIRTIEKNDKWGYMFYIKYDGTKFHSFDEMSGKRSVKGRFKEIMNELGFTWAKGIQQGGRTDAKVSATENILYVSSKFDGDRKELQERFNFLSDDSLKITMIKKTIPNLVFPEMIARREYIYEYPKKRVKNSLEEIREKLRLPEEIVQDIEDTEHGIVVLNGKYYIFIEENGEKSFGQLKFEHKLENKIVDFDIDDESDGTQRVVDFLPMLFRLEEKKILCTL